MNILSVPHIVVLGLNNVVAEAWGGGKGFAIPPSPLVRLVGHLDNGLVYMGGNAYLPYFSCKVTLNGV